MVRIWPGPRLQRLAELMPADVRRVADVGTDHGRLAILLAARPNTERVLATDLRPAPLAAARAELAATDPGVAEKIKLRLGDGLDPLHGQRIEGVCVAGIGGAVITRMLESARLAGWLDESVRTLVLNPLGRPGHLRAWLRDHGWEIEHQAEVVERGRLYDLLAAVRGDGDRAYRRIAMECPLALALRVGPAAVCAPSEELIRRIDHELEHAEQVLRSVGARPPARARASRIYQQLAELSVLLKRRAAARRLHSQS